jgi:excisionase family DNA binding protein
LSASTNLSPAFDLQAVNDNAKVRSMQLALGNWLSVNEAATMLGLTVGRIRQLLIAEELRGRKLNEKAWVIDRREVERFARKTGRELHAVVG